MNARQTSNEATRSFYVAGSGLFPVPEARVNEIPALRSAFHQQELERAWLLALARRAP